MGTSICALIVHSSRTWAGQCILLLFLLPSDNVSYMIWSDRNRISSSTPVFSRMTLRRRISLFPFLKSSLYNFLPWHICIPSKYPTLRQCSTPTSLCLQLVFGGCVLIGIVRTLDFGYCLLIGIARTIDLEGGLLIASIVQTTDYGDCLLIGIVRTRHGLLIGIVRTLDFGDGLLIGIVVRTIDLGDTLNWNCPYNRCWRLFTTW